MTGTSGDDAWVTGEIILKHARAVKRLETELAKVRRLRNEAIRRAVEVEGESLRFVAEVAGLTHVQVLKIVRSKED